MKLLLDTNVVSEAGREGANLGVRRWLDSHREEDIFLSAVTIAEIRQGIAQMSAGKRRSTYDAWLGEIRLRYEGRIIAITEDVADRWGRFAGEMRRKGHAMPIMDGFIAATAAVHSCVIATRNVRHFQQFDIDVVDPWQAAT